MNIRELIETVENLGGIGSTDKRNRESIHFGIKRDIYKIVAYRRNEWNIDRPTTLNNIKKGVKNRLDELKAACPNAYDVHSWDDLENEEIDSETFFKEAEIYNKMLHLEEFLSVLNELSKDDFVKNDMDFITGEITLCFYPQGNSGYFEVEKDGIKRNYSISEYYDLHLHNWEVLIGSLDSKTDKLNAIANAILEHQKEKYGEGEPEILKHIDKNIEYLESIRDYLNTHEYSPLHQILQTTDTGKQIQDEQTTIPPSTGKGKKPIPDFVSLLQHENKDVLMAKLHTILDNSSAGRKIAKVLKALESKNILVKQSYNIPMVIETFNLQCTKQAISKYMVDKMLPIEEIQQLINILP
ncbi:MAG: hypothetical protein P4L28_05430 [Paludibacteraceae bacterium]|nr:hypothetical protein [Paludibacteraceae bacterium]